MAQGFTKWLALQDVDEFFQLYSFSESNGTEPAKVLLNFIAEKERQNPELGGFSFGNCFFGTSNTTGNPTSYIKEWTLRTKYPVGEDRHKLIVNPDRIDYFCIHEISTGNKPYYVDSKTEGRHVHYRFPYLFQFGSALSNAANVLEDTSMSERFGDLIVKRLKQNFENES